MCEAKIIVRGMARGATGWCTITEYEFSEDDRKEIEGALSLITSSGTTIRELVEHLAMTQNQTIANAFRGQTGAYIAVGGVLVNILEWAALDVDVANSQGGTNA